MIKKSGKGKAQNSDIPRGIVIILLIAIILISAINTFAILSFINNAGANTPTEEVTTVGSQQGGILKLTLIEAPTEEETATGEKNE